MPLTGTMARVLLAAALLGNAAALDSSRAAFERWSREYRRAYPSAAEAQARFEHFPGELKHATDAHG